MDSNAFLWLAGTSITGFLFLAGWCWNLHEKYAAISGTAKKVDEIHIALLGTMDKEGQISKLRRLEEKCRLRHGDE